MKAQIKLTDINNKHVTNILTVDFQLINNDSPFQNISWYDTRLLSFPFINYLWLFRISFFGYLINICFN